MGFKLKGFGFLTLFASQAFLTACSATLTVANTNHKNESDKFVIFEPQPPLSQTIPKPEAEPVIEPDAVATPPVQNAEVQIKPDSSKGVYSPGFKFNTNFIPKVNTKYRPGYDLSFALKFGTSWKEAYGTGWLIDWKDVKQDNKFTAYLATNLHVADSLRNKDDYKPYNKDGNQKEFLPGDITTEFSLGKYIDAQTVQKLTPEYQNLKHLNNRNSDALVSIQTSKLPKTAYTATDFIKTAQYKYNHIVSNTVYELDLFQNAVSYADFAVLELELNLANNRDQQIFDSFINPAVTAYEKLGNSLGLFSNLQLDQYVDDTHYLLGYPLLKREKTSYWNLPQKGYSSPLYENSNKEVSRITRNIRKDDEIPGSRLVQNQINYLPFAQNDPKGVMDFSKYLNYVFNYHEKQYQHHGYGLLLEDTDFPGGSSGSPLFNQNKQINSIYFAALPSKSYGVSQILRATQNKDKSKNYDLIFGDSNTKKYYAQFAKEHKTHLYHQILQSNDEQFRFVENDQTVTSQTPFKS
ncbi:DUF31 family protein [Mycoplasmoides pneumoniae]|uniref:Uncharacterized lipoprotein MPN_592 n=1 Tax=Mycoplasma pneumoniae (strain ATCC 29342 / M129 / Subtype 1) TaxID=272634 RepID=Y592_MYCPN|nr:DUF31 family protein [Mycoplasmoides pneumoniae]Q50335.1 RecName: Full=Uncharacterized lipoprotein MPN_592; Flags: Precursor [Mycoplasmoides pneumoniae M129]AAB95898.1 conserved hypothetical protein [Mycoplasmoides pneumoniae M129]AAC43664.1 putative lipoprotein [Mycoplasmoides pneumoniae]AGC04467.1 hypothetical protein C985_0598 [Mycoplasmoides pneumoniae M129-B7]ALA30463.1 hypothetical protein C897_03365 [Mycoplasmoides pneumoniae PI 1428]ALA32569.1 hypothetical protein F533_03365 [Mycop